MIKKLGLIILFLLFVFSGISLSQVDEDGWYLQGDPVISKDKEIDLPPCHTERTVNVGDGEGHGSINRSEDCFKDGSGVYESKVTWTVPDKFLKPGKSIDFAMTCTSPLADIPTSGLIGYDNHTILQALSTNPEVKSTGSFIVPDASYGDEMAIYAKFVAISGLHGDVVYNYKYLRAGEYSAFADKSQEKLEKMSSEPAPARGEPEDNVEQRALDEPEERKSDGNEPAQNNILETISSSIKKSAKISVATPAKEPEPTEKIIPEDKDEYSDKSAFSDEFAKPIRPLKILSQVATGDYEWNPQNFAGLYYDLNSDTGTESITSTLTDGKLSGSYPYGLTYRTIAQQNRFAFKDWGSYNVIGLFGEKYFAGYLDNSGSIDERLFDESGEKNPLSKNKLLRVLMNDNHEKTVTTATPLELEDGYILSIDSIYASGDAATVTLSRAGTKLATKKLFPSRDGATMAEKTFLFREDFGSSRDVLIIAVHFKNVFRGADLDLATVDGIWQLSTEAVDVSEGTNFDKMTVQAATAEGIVMNNAGSDLILGRNKDISLLPGMGIKTADSEKLRYCLYREIADPKDVAVRGAVATDSYSWNAANFAGFYYDIDEDLETELLKTSINDGKLAEPDGITYTTDAIKTELKFEDWGSFRAIGFLGEKCFAEYVSDSSKGLLFDKSTDKSALAKKQLLKILADDDAEKTITTGSPLRLEDGFALAIKSISTDGNNVYLELSKNGEAVHSAIMYPSYDAAATADNTYIYKGDAGEMHNVVLIAVHFKNAFRGADQNLATIDGLWQLSDEPISVKEMTSFGKLSISDIAASRIIMNNIGNPITLSKNKYISLAGDIYLQTADSNQLRYYIVREIGEKAKD
jgi:S-layer protein (TIGR01567 family)